MKTAMESKISSMEALIQEKTGTLDRTLAENEQLQHKTQTLESRLADSQTELSEANKKYTDLHQNFVERVIFLKHFRLQCAIQCVDGQNLVRALETVSSPKFRLQVLQAWVLPHLLIYHTICCQKVFSLNY